VKRLVRRKRSSFGRLRPFWIVGVVIAGLAAWSGAYVVSLPAFHLQSLAITGLSRVARSDVVAKAAIDPRANVWLLDPHAIATRIEAIPYVATAHVYRRPLANVWIDVTERAPDACVRDSRGHESTIDRTLRVLETGCSRQDLVLFALQAPLAAGPGSFVRDPELAELEGDARLLGPQAGSFEGFAHDRFGELDATLRDGIEVKFGDDADLDRKQRLVGPILAELGQRANQVEAVDVRAPATPVVEFRPTAGRPSTPPHSL
jgi:cell division septal protein FtsQ